MLLAPGAQAFFFANVSADFPDTVVGQTFPAGLGIQNSSTPPQSTNFPTLKMAAIDLYPACSSTNVDCGAGTAESGVYDLAPGVAVNGTGIGQSIPAGNATCETGTWTIIPDNPNPFLSSRWRFVPPGGEATLILATGEVCSVSFTATTLRVPSIDVNAAPGVQTNHATGVTPIPQNPLGVDQAPQGRQGLSTENTIFPTTPGLSTTASQSGPTVPGTTTDTALLSPPPPPGSGSGIPPTGSITFDLYGSGDPTCAGAPIFTNNVPVNLGFTSYPASASAVITVPGTYRWVATYSGDVNYAGSSTGCGDPAETVTFIQATPAISTQATPTVTIGSSINDTATVTGVGGGVAAPTGTVTFTLFGPGNPTCTGAPIFTSAAVALAGGPPPTANSGPFTPTSPGTYNWVAAYSGDSNYVAITSPCGDTNESSVVNQALGTITTQATPTVTIGSPISDTATVTGAVAPAPTPTGSVIFTLFGPGNPTCTGAPIFTSAAQPIGGGPPPTANSGPFTPTSPGTYTWVAVYSGDANYPTATSPCGAPNEASVVNQSVATIATQALTPVTIGSPINDTATVTGGAAPAPAPTGTVTFTLFGPANPACTGAAIFTSATRPLGGGPPPTAMSADFTPTAIGTYNWVAVYSGDANYTSVTSACGAANEASVVNQSTAVITTTATATAPVAGAISDTATVTGGPAPAPTPTGSVTFTLFGPGNPTCTGAAIFTSAARPLAGGPPPTATSATFNPGAPGSYNWVAVYSGDANYPSATSACGAPNETTLVNQATIATSALTPVTLGSPISDTATVTGGAPPAATPTGTVVFTLFGPANPTCTGAAIFTSAAVPIAGGPPPTANSGNFTPTAVGTYNWVAVYSGDANYPAATSPCGAPNEASVVNQATPTIVTSALTPVAIGSPVSDTATVTGVGAIAPTGTVTFTLFGPANPTCTGAAIFTSAAAPLAGGPPPTASSGNFVPPAPGTYNWVAVYSGDTNYTSVTSPCGAPNEASVVSPGTVAIATTATASAPLGGTVSDTATVTGGVAPAPTPTGTVVFTLFGPGDPTCAAAAIFTSAAVPIAGGPPPTANSGPFLPLTAGSYNWVAVYSGDVNYPSATSACGAANETSVVNSAAITTSATPTVAIGNPIADTATVTGSAVAPTGTVIFTLFGPANPTCTGAAIFTSAAQPLAGGPPPTATSGNFTPTQPGTYNWVAVYSGDANYPSVTSPCGAPNEASVITQGQPTITTQAFGPVTLTQPIRDTATVTGSVGAPTPTGTVTFTLFGPGNPTCTGAAIFTSAAVPLAGGPPPTATSGDFTPTAVGSYNWVAVYSGDAGNASVTSPCGAPNEVSVVTAVPTIAVDKTATPLSRPEPGGDFTFNILVTNTSTEVLTITSLTDDVYGDLTTRAGSTCNTAIGTVLQPSPGPGNTYACSFVGPFTGNAGDSQTDVVTVHATNPAGVDVTDNDDAVVTITNDPPQIQIVKDATPLTRPEPGGSFTYNLVVSNPDTVEAVTITALTDNIYGNLDDPANPAVTNNTCLTAVGTVLQPSPGPSDTFSCSFDASFTGNGGDTLTDIVTVTGVDDDNTTVTDTDDAVVTITGVAPVIQIDKTANPLTRPEPGGAYTFTLVITNPGTVEAVTITTLVDDVYGNLDDAANPAVTANTCVDAVGTVLATSPGPGNTFTCSFTGQFTGDAGDSQTDVATVTGVDDDNTTVTDTDDAVVTITDVAPVIQIDKTANPLTRPEPGGAYTFTLVITNPGTVEPVTITTLVDDVYGNLDDAANPAVTANTCVDAVGTVLAPSPGPGNTFTCSFTGQFTGNSGDSQTDVATVTGVDDDNTTVTDTDDAVVTITNVPPVIQIDKTADPLTRPEPGGAFTFTLVITNTGTVEPVTITTLVDDVYGNLDDAANPAVTANTCVDAVGTVLQPSPGPGNTFTCSFTGQFSGNAGSSQTDVATVTGVDDDNTTVTDSDEAVVDIVNVVPAIRVLKGATPLSRPEPGGAFTFDVSVTNTGPNAITVTSLTDDVYGNLDSAANPAVTNNTCLDVVGTVLQPGASVSCTFVGQFTGIGGAAQTDVVTATGVDAGGEAVSDDDTAIVTVTPVAPSIDVVKSATPSTRPEPGGGFTFNVVITNTSTVEPITITALTDDKYGNLDDPNNPLVTSNTCLDAVGRTLAVSPGPNHTFSCSFVGQFTGTGGATQTDIVTVTGVDDDGQSASDLDDATVSITTQPPSIDVDKSATPSTRTEPGGAFTFNVVITNTSTVEPITITGLDDDVYGDLDDPNNPLVTSNTCLDAVGRTLAVSPGPNHTFSCSFVGQFTGTGGATQTDIVTVTGVDDDGQSASDLDDATVSLTTETPTVNVDKTATPLTRPEPGGGFTFNVVITNTSSAEAITITSLTDDKYGNLLDPNNPKVTSNTCLGASNRNLAPGASFPCSFVGQFTGGPGSQTDIVTVSGQDDDGQTATDNDDAVVAITDVPPAVDVVKTANPLNRPEPGGAFTFTVVVTNTSPSEPLTIDTLTDDIYGNLLDSNNSKVTSNTCLNLRNSTLAPGASVSCSFVGQFTGEPRSQTDIVTVSGRDDEGSRATDRDDAVAQITDVPPTVTVVKDADPASRPAPGGSFTFNVAVTNTSFEPVTLVSLTDDVYGNLNGKGNCATGGVIQPAATYRCQFTVDFRGNGGATQVDRVFATVVDNDNTQASANDDARISITPLPVTTPTLPPTVVAPPPTAAPTQLGRTGSDVGGAARLALGLLVAGLLLVGASWGAGGRSRLAFAPGGPIGPGGPGGSGGPGGMARFTREPSDRGARRFGGGGRGGTAAGPPRAPAPEPEAFERVVVVDAIEAAALGSGDSSVTGDDTPDDFDGPYDFDGPDDDGPPSGGVRPPTGQGPSGGGQGSGGGAVAPADADAGRSLESRAAAAEVVPSSPTPVPPPLVVPPTTDTAGRRFGPEVIESSPELRITRLF